MEPVIAIDKFTTPTKISLSVRIALLEPQHTSHDLQFAGSQGPLLWMLTGAVFQLWPPPTEPANWDIPVS